MKVTFAVLALGAWPAFAETVCDSAAIEAALASGVPLPVMTAITRAETQTRRDGVFGPWPWTLNHAGSGEWFDSKDAALVRMEGLLAAGESFDVGCFQINTRWHGHEFASLDEMIDPHRNAGYAAHYLTELYSETGSWKAAVAAYHSRDPDRGEGYAERVASIMRDPDTPVTAPELAAPYRRENAFPLLVAGDAVSQGSLFGAGRLGRPLIGP